MPYLVGTDEAGYGPNLGPLIISTSVWHVAEPPHEVDLYQRLAHVIRGGPRQSTSDGRLAIADSKLLYKRRGSLAELERGVLSGLGVLGCRPARWREMWSVLAGESGAARQPLPWYQDYECRTPVAVADDDLDAAIANLREGTSSAGVRLVALASVAVFPKQFNELTEQLGTKGAALTRLTLELLGEALLNCDEPVLVICDKHGGRNRYAAHLQEEFPDYLVQVRRESRAESVYRLGPAAAQVEVRFRTRGERFLPTALASMASKYLRELAMAAFNRFWCEKLPDLRPTAGYPQDARRFKRDISAAQRELRIDDDLLWRNR